MWPIDHGSDYCQMSDFLDAFLRNLKSCTNVLAPDLIIEFYLYDMSAKIIALFGNEGTLLMFANKAGSTLGSGEATLETDDGPS